MDLEDYILTRVKNHLDVAIPGVAVTSISDQRPARFPALAVEITSKAADKAFDDSMSTDPPVIFSVRLTAFSAAQTGPREEVKNILETAAKPLKTKHFTLRSYDAPRKDGTGICHAFAIYEAGWDGETFYTR